MRLILQPVVCGVKIRCGYNSYSSLLLSNEPSNILMVGLKYHFNKTYERFCNDYSWIRQPGTKILWDTA